MTPTLVVALIVIAIGAVGLYRSVRIVPQATADIVERLGRYQRTLHAGLNIVLPFIDQIRLRVDLREQVISFQPQPVITQDNLVVHIDTVIYYQVTDPRAATYEVAHFLTAIEQLTVTTLRNVIGGMDLERTLTSREEINTELRGVLDEATGKWGIRVNRVELKAIDPPASIKDSMEKQMRADRDKRASILSAEGQKQSAILTAEGERTAAVLRARGEAEAAVLRAEADAKAQAARARGQAQAITTVVQAIHDGNVDQRLLAYQYLQTLPELAKGSANKVWFVPSEMGRALEGLGGLFNAATADRRGNPAPSATTTAPDPLDGLAVAPPPATPAAYLPPVVVPPPDLVPPPTAPAAPPDTGPATGSTPGPATAAAPSTEWVAAGPGSADPGEGRSGLDDAGESYWRTGVPAARGTAAGPGPTRGTAGPGPTQGAVAGPGPGPTPGPSPQAPADRLVYSRPRDPLGPAGDDPNRTAPDAPGILPEGTVHDPYSPPETQVDRFGPLGDVDDDEPPYRPFRP